MYVDALVANVLDPAAAKMGKTVKVVKGYLCEKHTKKVEGTMESGHLSGLAADVCVDPSEFSGNSMDDYKKANKELAKHIVRTGRFDQVVLMNVGELDLKPTFVHVSYNRRLNRGMVMKKVVGNARIQSLTTDEISNLIF